MPPPSRVRSRFFHVLCGVDYTATCINGAMLDAVPSMFSVIERNVGIVRIHVEVGVQKQRSHGEKSDLDRVWRKSIM